MRSNIKNIIIIMALGIIFILSTVSNFNLIDDQGNNDGTTEIRDKTNLKNPKKSGSYSESFIHIDEDNPLSPLLRGGTTGKRDDKIAEKLELKNDRERKKIDILRNYLLFWL